mmetsp:Transcript_25229/g.63298  ORF Transcript_25229/g.63298 Transcript_25229/m.63298 type:complete len:301 (-) Transcript_25229:381-1283(-)
MSVIPGTEPAFFGAGALASKRRVAPHSIDPHGLQRGLADNGIEARPGHVQRRHYDTPPLSVEPEAKSMMRITGFKPTEPKPGGVKRVPQQLPPVKPAAERVHYEKDYIERNATYSLEDTMMRKTRAEAGGKEGEYTLDDEFGRHRRVRTLEEKRNGIPTSLPGDKPYGAPELEDGNKFFSTDLRPGDGAVSLVRETKGLFRADEVKGVELYDKQGRPKSEYIKLFVRTPTEKITIDLHKHAKVAEIEALCNRLAGHRLYFEGQLCESQESVSDYGVTMNSTIYAEEIPKVYEKKATYAEK